METTKTETVGAFASSLKRSHAKIREDRAKAIVSNTQLLYKRNIEDLQVKIEQLKMEQENLLDLSPTSADSLVLASDFKSDVYVAKDIDLGVSIRQLTIKLEVAQARYSYLFGGAV